ncbi:5-oxoproline transporter, DUF969 family subunit [Sphingobium aquiterrae]|uniref:5-oxoproline transporter, DUF969 family subunit n=1 Tax=Sphingobium aquiterrae TaxID=2038656 RepID=UPI00301650AB
MWILSGVAVVIIGFVLRLNALLVVTLAALATALAAGMGPVAAIAAFGKAFADNRFIAIPWLILPVIGLLERGGIRERARMLVAKLPVATPGRVLIGYLALRQISASLGLNALGGHVQMVRPVVAPMAEAAAGEGSRAADPQSDTREAIRAHAAAADNVGLFFGEDLFVAVGSILLIISFMEQYGVMLAPLAIAKWAVPTAIAAFVIHGSRLLWLDRAWSRAR